MSFLILNNAFSTRFGRFTTPDPAADQYPSLSPYSYCAANPLRYEDPTGCEILINGLRYDIGMGYDGPDDFTRRTVDALNMVADFGGSKLLNDLIDSENVFDFLPTDSAASYTMAAGGSTSVNLSTALGRDEYVKAAAHESMHAAQFLHGQGGASAYNEVEAYAFSEYLTLNSVDNFGTDKYLHYTFQQADTYIGELYYAHFRDLYNPKTIKEKGLFGYNMLISTFLFKGWSTENATGVYDKIRLFPNISKNKKLKSILHLYL